MATWRALIAIAAFLVGVIALQQPAGAQSGGCAGGPFVGSTTLDSDGDGVNDADEIVSGTNECDPASTPVRVCGDFVASYDPATFDFDNDGDNDAAERAAGTDPCDSTSVISAAVTTTTAAPTTPTETETTTTIRVAAVGVDEETQAPPQLALTGPSTATLAAVVGVATLLLGAASLAVGRRVEA